MGNEIDLAKQTHGRFHDGCVVNAPEYMKRFRFKQKLAKFSIQARSPINNLDHPW